MNSKQLGSFYIEIIPADLQDDGVCWFFYQEFKELAVSLRIRVLLLRA